MYLQLSVSLLVLHLVRVLQIEAESCITPGGEQGQCVFISDCTALLNIFSNPVGGTEEAIGKFRCRDSKRDLHVCCVSRWTSTNYGKELSDRRYCGLQHTDDYFSTGNTRSLDEFPWLAALVGTDPNTGRKRIACHGSLINNRYILTAAQCFKSRFALEFNISKVLLGKFLAEKETACVEHAQYGDECAKSEEFGIEEKIIHPFFYTKNGLNDIALLRLNTIVSYTDYIRPICFPNEDTLAKTGDVLYSTGWGDVNFNGPIATLKKKINTTLVSPQECQISYPELKIIPTYHMCTLDSANNSEFSCTGDVGAPVMFTYKTQWHIEGILSKGKGCGSKFPGVNTKVSNYLDWIKQNIRP